MYQTEGVRRPFRLPANSQAAHAGLYMGRPAGMAHVQGDTVGGREAEHAPTNGMGDLVRDHDDHVRRHTLSCRSHSSPRKYFNSNGTPLAAPLECLQQPLNVTHEHRAHMDVIVDEIENHFQCNIETFPFCQQNFGRETKKGFHHARCRFSRTLEARMRRGLFRPKRKDESINAAAR